MSPLSIAASVAGFLSLAIELTKIISTYVADVKSAPSDASALRTEITALCKVLKMVEGILRSDKINGTFDEQSILYSIINACQRHFTTVYEKLATLPYDKENSRRSTGIMARITYSIKKDKVKETMARITWPLKKEECQQAFKSCTVIFKHWKFC
ncbi:hypothetical protein FPQ18DRAFT_43339 [Pyronema domesticum]|nr:hypothetical protein FPQ18DRAFT_43339 [Pyronema domesticum]